MITKFPTINLPSVELKYKFIHRLWPRFSVVALNWKQIWWTNRLAFKSFYLIPSFQAHLTEKPWFAPFQQNPRLDSSKRSEMNLTSKMLTWTCAHISHTLIWMYQIVCVFFSCWTRLRGVVRPQGINGP